jgi:16S rRNA (uracil1498-N3)-methyltransferase
MLPRFFVPALDPARGEAVLPDEEGRHLTRVLRLSIGDEIAVFDGNGREFRAIVAYADRAGVRVVLEDALEPPPDPPVRLTLAQAVIKGDKMDDVVRDATMLGVAAVQPIVSARTVVQALPQDRVLQRWRRVAIASAKQCRRARLPAIQPPLPFDGWLALNAPEIRLLLLEPGAGGAQPVRALQDRDRPAEAALVVGPEGGWTADERDAAIARGCIPITLGPLTLRADAVALAAIAALSVVWQ